MTGRSIDKRLKKLEQSDLKDKFTFTININRSDGSGTRVIKGDKTGVISDNIHKFVPSNGCSPQENTPHDYQEP